MEQFELTQGLGLDQIEKGQEKKSLCMSDVNYYKPGMSHILNTNLAKVQGQCNCDEIKLGATCFEVRGS